MPSNRALWRSLHSLAHPVTLAALLLLLANDHWLRWQHPSWLTGKLGDAAWLAFAPLVAAVGFSLIIPARFRQQERCVGWLVFAKIGLWFAAAKTLPVAHQLTLNMWHALVGWESSLRLDTTDLLTLPALLVGWWVWRRAPNTPVNLRPAAYIALALGAVLTMANQDGAYSPGILCVAAENEKIFASSGSGISIIYRSLDGGLTWEKWAKDPILPESTYCPRSNEENEQFTLEDASQSDRIYRFRPEHSIDVSEDGGNTWQQVVDIEVLHEEMRHNVYANNPDYRGSVYANLGPFDTLIDPNTGNLIVAMGDFGVLVRTPDLKWQWVAVGLNHRIIFDQPIPYFNILWRELLEALVGVFLLFTSLMPNRDPGRRTIGPTFVAWFEWVLVVSIFLPSADLVNPIFWLNCIFIAIGVIAFLMVISTKHFSVKKFRRILPIALAMVLVFMLPFVLWANGSITNYGDAAIYSLILTAGCIGAGIFSVRRLEKPAPEPATAT
jgi:hypothetical protein